MMGKVVRFLCSLTRKNYEVLLRREKGPEKYSVNMWILRVYASRCQKERIVKHAVLIYSSINSSLVTSLLLVRNAKSHEPINRYPLERGSFSFHNTRTVSWYWNSLKQLEYFCGANLLLIDIDDWWFGDYSSIASRRHLVLLIVICIVMSRHQIRSKIEYRKIREIYIIPGVLITDRWRMKH